MGIAENLKRLREAAGLSQTELGKRAGVSQQLIQKIETNQYYRITKLPEIARALGVPMHEVDENFVSVAPLVPGNTAPLISWVSAGSLKKPEDVSALEDAKRISAPDLDPKGIWIALTVEGDSMDKISPPDSIIFVNLKDRRLVANACYVIANGDEGESTYKRFRPSPARFEPVSTNKNHKPLLIKGNRYPKIIGRVRRTLLYL
jgi:transcriptional regulator with XRE-family HTH domain